jgi:hypothetical protein
MHSADRVLLGQWTHVHNQTIDAPVMNNYGRLGTQEPLAAQSGVHSFSSEALVLISRRPTKRRDNEYAAAYLVVIACMILLSFMTSHGVIRSTFIIYGEEGSWVSMVMIATMMGTFLGNLLNFLLYSHEIRETLFNVSLMTSVCLQLGLAMIIIDSETWWVLALICMCSAAADCIKFRKARRYMTIAVAIIDTAIDVNARFGYAIGLFCISIGIVQCCVLLWWSAVFVRVMSGEIDFLFVVLVFVFSLSFYWTVQFFHSIVSCVVSGCFLWYFLDDSNKLEEATDAAVTTAGKRVLLYVHCALTSSLGSLIKAAFWGPLSHAVLVAIHWSREREAFTSPMFTSLRALVNRLLTPLEGTAGKYNRLGTGYVAIYGHTFCRAASEVSRDDISGILLDDTTSYTLKMLSTTAAGVVSILLAIIGSRQEGTSWPLFVFACFLLSYAGVSLSLHAYRCAVDALVIAYSDNPHKFESLNPIIFHRFLRTTEIPQS